ncbi:MAG: ComF family protein [Candidatus Kryptoniota bacterium]
MNQLIRLAESFFDFVYPPICVTCDGELKKGEKYICSYCWDNFERVAKTETVIQLIESKFIADDAVDKLESVFLFQRDARIRLAIHMLKYAHAVSIAEPLGRFIAYAVINDEKLSNVDYIIPVPLHRARFRERGYNQSELISRVVGKELNLPLDTKILIRTKYTETQTRLDLPARAVNVRGAFAVHRSRTGTIIGRSYLLIDDVITTGATIRECAKVLKSYGAANVYAASAAIAL